MYVVYKLYNVILLGLVAVVSWRVLDHIVNSECTPCMAGCGRSLYLGPAGGDLRPAAHCYQLVVVRTWASASSAVEGQEDHLAGFPQSPQSFSAPIW